VGVVRLSSVNYWYCDARLNWTNYSYVPTEFVNLTFRGVVFKVSGYDTIDCPVVEVVGTESGGPHYSFLIYGTPMNCNITTPAVFSPDGLFGAGWSGGLSIRLLVRTA
jgi:hypothetical protein